MGTQVLNKAYIYIATTTDSKAPLDTEAKYPITGMWLSTRAERYINSYGICVKIGCTTAHPKMRAYQLEREKGVITVNVQTMQTTPAGLLLAESVLRTLLENHPATHQVGTDTFQIDTPQDREDILSHWSEWVQIAIDTVQQIKGA